MKTLYLDVFSGISGDMFLGAMLDLGVELRSLERELSKLGLRGYHLHAARKQNSQIEGVKFDVHLEAEHHHDDQPEHGHSHPHEQEHDESRDFLQIAHLIRTSGLSEWVKQSAVAVFRRIAEAEGKVHGHPPERVHFHEIGAIDSIVDIVGACVALEQLGRPRVLSAPVVDGTGWVDCAHGRFPVPTTATLEILGARGIALTQCDEPYELVTPTGAALLAEFVETFGPMQNLVASKIGYGLGTRQNKTRPNVLRAILGEPADARAGTGLEQRDWEMDTVCVIETDLDDCTPEVLGYCLERAMNSGALDAFHTPIQMKKNRPGVLLTVLCAMSDADRLSELLLTETTAFGIRRYTAERRKLRRESKLVQTPYGEVSVKMGVLNGKVLQASPEFESCKKLALARGAPLSAIYEAALCACGPLRGSAGQAAGQ